MSISGITGVARADVSFVRDIAPIVLKRCTGCHGDKINLGGYRANTFQYLMKKTASGKPAVVPGKPEESSFYKLVSTSNAALRMPRSDDALSVRQIAMIRVWIAEGAKFDGADPSASLRSTLGPRLNPPAPTSYHQTPAITALAILPSSLTSIGGTGAKVATAGYNEIAIWSLENGSLLRRIGDLPQRIQAMACNPNGRLLLVVGGSPGEYGEASIVDLDAPVGAKRTVLGTYADIGLCAAYNMDGSLIAIGCADGSVSVYDSKTRKRVWTSNIHSDWVTSVSFSYDGRFVASASKDMTVKVHNLADGGLFTTYNGHCRQLGAYKGSDPVYAVRFLPNSTDVMSAGGGKWLQQWNPDKAKEEAGSAADMEERFAKQGHTIYIAHGFIQPVLAFSPGPDEIFVASADGNIKEFNLTTRAAVKTYTGHTDWIYSLDFDAAAHRLVSGAFNGEVKIWNTQTGKCTLTFVAQPGLAITSHIAADTGRPKQLERK